MHALKAVFPACAHPCALNANLCQPLPTFGAGTFQQKALYCKPDSHFCLHEYDPFEERASMPSIALPSAHYHWKAQVDLVMSSTPCLGRNHVIRRLFPGLAVVGGRNHVTRRRPNNHEQIVGGGGAVAPCAIFLVSVFKKRKTKRIVLFFPSPLHAQWTPNSHVELNLS